MPRMIYKKFGAGFLKKLRVMRLEVRNEFFYQAPLPFHVRLRRKLRNTLYISCQERGPDGPGYLLAPDWDGRPVIMAVEQLRHHTGERIDHSECRGRLGESAFKDIYAQYLLWKLPEDGADVLAALSRSNE